MECFPCSTQREIQVLAVRLEYRPKTNPRDQSFVWLASACKLSLCCESLELQAGRAEASSQVIHFFEQVGH